MSLRNRMLAEMGIRPIWRLRDTAALNCDISETQSAQQPVVESPESKNIPVVLSSSQEEAPGVLNTSSDSWEELSAEVSTCTRCGLCKARKQAVLGVGDRNADWMFVGEGPGAEEDERGEPFVGQAGKLLDAMLAAIELQRAQGVYIANAVKCRPPGNRTPEAEEISACRPYLLRQIEMVRPKLLVALGRPAVQTLLGTEMSIAAARGKVHHFGEIPVVVSYHPAYLLRNLPDKSKAWEDLCRAQDVFKSIQN